MNCTAKVCLTEEKRQSFGNYANYCQGYMPSAVAGANRGYDVVTLILRLATLSVLQIVIWKY
jgi:hypothetical protein